MKITLKMLESACKPQRDLFAGIFGQEVELTLELCVKHASLFDWDWAAANLLTTHARAAYEAARATAFFNAATANPQSARNTGAES